MRKKTLHMHMSFVKTIFMSMKSRDKLWRFWKDDKAIIDVHGGRSALELILSSTYCILLKIYYCFQYTSNLRVLGWQNMVRCHDKRPLEGILALKVTLGTYYLEWWRLPRRVLRDLVTDVRMYYITIYPIYLIVHKLFVAHLLREKKCFFISPLLDIL